MRRRLKPRLPEVAQPKRRTGEAIFAAVLAAFVALVSAGLTWYSSDRSLKLALIQSCVMRIDEQEAKLREKAGVFLARQAEWYSKTINPEMKHEEYYRSGELAIAAAQDLSVNAPLRLGLAAVMAADSIRMVMTAKTKEERLAVQSEISKEGYDWPSFFFKEIDNYRLDRLKCKVNPGEY